MAREGLHREMTFEKRFESSGTVSHMSICKGRGRVEVRECSRLSDRMCKGKAASVIIYLVSTEGHCGWGRVSK